MDLIVDILFEEGYNNILKESSGLKALPLIREIKPDLLILDIMLPDMDGYEICSTLQDSEETSDIPIIMLTAKISDEDLKRGFEVGAFDYIKKPFDEVELIARVQSALKFKQSRDELKEKNTIVRHKLEAEEDLRQSEDKWRLLVQNVSDTVITVENDGTIIRINRTLPHITLEEVIGSSIYDYIPSEYYSWTKKSIEHIFKTGKSATYEVLGTGPGGPNTAWYETRAVPIERDNQVVAVMLISTEITERKNSEKALRESEEKYRKLVEDIPDVIYSLNSKGDITSVNKASKTVFGLEPQEIIGRNFSEFFKKEVLNQAKSRLRQVITGRYIATEGIMVDNNGKTHNIEYSSTPIIKDGKIVGARGMVRDVTERKRVENLILIQRDLGMWLGSALYMEDGLRLCVEAALKVSYMDCGGIYLVDDKSGDLDLAYHKGLSSYFVKSASHFNSDSKYVRLVMASKPIYNRKNEFDKNLKEAEQCERLRAIATFPVCHEDQVIGCIYIASHIFNEERF